MSNKLEEKIKKYKVELQSRRGTGRTTKMLKETVIEALKGNSGDYFLVVSHTPTWAKDMMEMTIKILRDLGVNPRVRPGNSLQVKEDVLILFRTEEWYEQPRNKRSVKFKNVYYDNVLSDISLENHIRWMEQELNPTPIKY